MDYPENIDCVWMVANDFGQIALFVTAGVGPIPVGYDLDLIKMVFTEINNLPIIADVNKVQDDNGNDYSSYFEMTEKGFFLYDWSYTKEIYQLICTPSVSLMFSNLNDEFKKKIDKFNIKTLFSDEINVEDYLICIRPID